MVKILAPVKLYTLVVGNYCLKETQLELLENIWDLGIQIDSNLKFHVHTNTVLIVFWALTVIFSECKDSDVIGRLYTTLACPIIEYNNVLWGPTYCDLLKVE